MKIEIYLSFNGNCKEAITFYQQCFDGDIAKMLYYKDVECAVSEEWKDKVMHSLLILPDGQRLLACDKMEDEELVIGNNISVSLEFKTKEEEVDVFKKLSEGGDITMPLQDTFWDAHFGMIRDKFGVNWLFNHQNK